MKHSQLFYLLVSAAVTAVFTACASKPAEINIIPQPNHITRGKGYVHLKGDNLTTQIDTTMGNPEGYRLTARDGRVEVVGGGEAGLFYGLQTLEQLRDGTDYVPVVTIEDAPRFPWRGMHFDVSRHFFSKDFIKKYIDMLAYHRINTFHWHLTDGIGWRIEIDKYPLLTQKAAWSKV